MILRHGARAADRHCAFAVEHPRQVRAVAFAAAVAPVDHVIMDIGVQQRFVAVFAGFIDLDLTPLRFAAAVIHVLQGGAVGERTGVDARHTVRDHYACQRKAGCKRRRGNACHPVRDRYACQHKAANERMVADGQNAVRNRHAFQRGAVIERRVADACYTGLQYTRFES